MSINIDNTAEAFAKTMIGCIKNGWLTERRTDDLISDMAGHLPLALSGQQRFARAAYKAFRLQRVKP